MSLRAASIEIGLLLHETGTGDGAERSATPRASRLRAIVDRAVRAERLGFDSIWIDGDTPRAGALRATTVLLAAIAARTTRLRLGAGVPLCAELDPLRIAEDFATLDGLSSGRVEVVVSARGFAAPIADAAAGDGERDRLRETADLLRRLWTETDVCWSGRIRGPLDGVTVQPRPVQQPHPPLWLGGGGDPRVDALAAELGLPLMPPCGSAPSPGPRVGACSIVAIDEPSTGPAGGGIAGSAADIVQRLLESREALGLDVQLVALGGAEAAAVERLERFGREVLPWLRSA